MLFEENENKQNEAGVGPFFKGQILHCCFGHVRSTVRAPAVNRFFVQFFRQRELIRDACAPHEGIFYCKKLYISSYQV